MSDIFTSNKHLIFGSITNQVEVRWKIMNGVQVMAKEVTTDHRKKSTGKERKRWKRPWGSFEYV